MGCTARGLEFNHRERDQEQGPVSRKSRNFTGVTIPFVSQERRGFKSSNLTDMFLLVSLKTYSKIGFSKQAVGSFTNGFSAPKRFRDFRETGSRTFRNWEWDFSSLKVSDSTI